MRRRCGISGWCTDHETDSNGDEFCRAYVEIDGIGYVTLSRTDDGTVAYVTDPKRGFHDSDIRGLYDLEDLAAVTLAYAEVLCIARSEGGSANVSACAEKAASWRA